MMILPKKRCQVGGQCIDQFQNLRSSVSLLSRSQYSLKSFRPSIRAPSVITWVKHIELVIADYNPVRVLDALRKKIEITPGEGELSASPLHTSYLGLLTLCRRRISLTRLRHRSRNRSAERNIFLRSPHVRQLPAQFNLFTFSSSRAHCSIPTGLQQYAALWRS